ncbi:GBS Bsp-like repeat-containing protein [[Clostridium] scindens]|uniref:GBS Bsp-like repeat-containing protein n=1 Tax=Clostridium scindens (strain JCM 10418 / VPI 12708) TaxID=29347 RepID=UPI00216A7469|nr:GBS Bsp-like repeat-containing protein [[Clostridium] scindens]
MKKIRKPLIKLINSLGTVFVLILTVLATVLCLSIRWMFDTWSNLTIDELLYHLSAPLDGTNLEMIKEYINYSIVPAILVFILFLILFITYRKQKKYFVIMGGGTFLALILSAFFIYSAWEQLDAGSYVKAQGVYSTFVDNYYVDPADTEIIFPEKKRNLIYIFLESMEITFTDQQNGGGLRKNIIPELSKLAKENEDFSGTDNELNGGYAMPGATWTIAAMFAQTSGLPLNISIDPNGMDTQESFFGNTVTLGDILEQAGYSQTLMIGSDATFGGRRLYFTEHGNYNILDYNYALDEEMIPKDYRVWWGYEDQKLFNFAKEKLLELAKQKEPFNFTLLTVDTHSEDGYICERCRNDFADNQYANVLACSSRQINDFVKWIQQQDFYENTTIVLVGDHPTMDSDFCENVAKNYDRKVYTSYINASVDTDCKEKRSYSTFDYFPTTLAAIGVEIQNNRLGLGTNLFSSEQTLTERFGINKVKNELNKKSKRIKELAKLDDKDQKGKIQEKESGDPVASIYAGDYQFELGILPITVTNIKNVQDIKKILIAVWTKEDQSNLQWIQMDLADDGTYYANINVPNFNYETGPYFVQAYTVNGSGEQFFVGTTIGYVN